MLVQSISTWTDLPAQSEGLPPIVKVYVSQFCPSTQSASYCVAPVGEPAAVPVHASDAPVVGLSVPDVGFAAWVIKTGVKQTATSSAKRAGRCRRLRLVVNARR